MYRFALVNGLSVSWIRSCIELVHRQAQRAYGPQLIPFGAQNETYKQLQRTVIRHRGAAHVRHFIMHVRRAFKRQRAAAELRR